MIMVLSFFPPSSSLFFSLLLFLVSVSLFLYLAILVSLRILTVIAFPFISAAHMYFLVIHFLQLYFFNHRFVLFFVPLHSIHISSSLSSLCFSLLFYFLPYIYLLFFLSVPFLSFCPSIIFSPAISPLRNFFFYSTEISHKGKTPSHHIIQSLFIPY